MEREGFSGAIEDTKEVVFPGLDRLLRQVAAVVVKWDELESHVCVTNFGGVGGREFVVEHLVFRNNGLQFHAGKGTDPDEDHLFFGLVFHGFHP